MATPMGLSTARKVSPIDTPHRRFGARLVVGFTAAALASALTAVPAFALAAPHARGGGAIGTPSTTTMPKPSHEEAGANVTPVCSVTGTIAVTDTDDDTPLGYVSDQWNGYGEYTITSSAADALSVTVPVGSPTDSEVNLVPTNGPNSSYPNVGAIQGYYSSDADLGENPNYLYLGGTATTAPGVPPQTSSASPNSFTNATGISEDDESAIWSLGEDGSITPQWVNSDSSDPATSLVYSQDVLLLVGDPGTFFSEYGGEDAGFTLQPTSTPCSQSIDFGALSDMTLGAAPFNVSATATSGLPISFTSETTSCTTSGTDGETVTLVATGLCTIEASQGGDTEYASATSVTESFMISPEMTSLTSTPGSTAVTLGATAPTLTDSAVLSGGDSPTGTITFTLFNPTNQLVDTETVTVDGDGTYTTPTGYTLPTSIFSVIGTYQWDASYSGDGTNAASSDDNDPAEQVTVYAASPSLVTTPTVTTATFGSATTLNDSAVLSGGYYPQSDITFTLTSPTGVVVDQEVVPVAGNGTYSTTGYALPTSNTGTVAGTWQWEATYSGDSNNSTVVAVGEQVVVSPAATVTTYTGTDEVGIDSSFVPTATLTSAAAGCQASQPVAFSLSSDPFNGSVETYALGSQNSAPNGTVTGATVSTNGWEDGVYMITASYAGTANCDPSSSTAVLSVTAPGLFALGGGSYAVPALGPTTFGFGVTQTRHGRTTNYAGQLTVVTNGKWMFQASVTGFGVTSSTQALLSGTGSLHLWTATLNHGRGGWALVASRVPYSATANATTRNSPGSFGVTISYTPTGSQPALPGYAPIALSHGGILIV